MELELNVRDKQQSVFYLIWDKKKIKNLETNYIMAKIVIMNKFKSNH